MTRFNQLADQYFDPATGNFLIDGFIKFEVSGGGAAKTTFADQDEKIPNSNPVPLSATGIPPNIFFTGEAKAFLLRNNLSQIRVLDPVPGGTDALNAYSSWSATITYSLNDIVRGDDDRYYISIGNGNIGNDPTATTTFWMETRLINVWDTNYTFAVGAIALASDGNLYRGITASNQGNDPVSNPSNWTIIGGTGDVVGPGSSTDNALARNDGTTGKLLQNSLAILDDSGNLTGIVALTTTGLITAAGVTIASGSDLTVTEGKISLTDTANEVALTVNSSATTSHAVLITNNEATFNNTANGLFSIKVDNSSASGTAFRINNDGGGSSQVINAAAASATVFDIIGNAQTTGVTLSAASHNALTTGAAFVAGGASSVFTSTNGMARIIVDNPSASGHCVVAQQDGSGFSYVGRVGTAIKFQVDGDDGGCRNIGNEFGAISAIKTKVQIIPITELYIQDLEDRYLLCEWSNYYNKNSMEAEEAGGKKATRYLGQIYEEVLEIFPSCTSTYPDTEEKVIGKEPVLRLKKVQETCECQVLVTVIVTPEERDPNGNITKPEETKKVQKTRKVRKLIEEAIQIVGGKVTRVLEHEEEVTEGVTTLELVFNEDGSPSMIDAADLDDDGKPQFDETGDDILGPVPILDEEGNQTVTGAIKNSIIEGVIPAILLQKTIKDFRSYKTDKELEFEAYKTATDDLIASLVARLDAAGL